MSEPDDRLKIDSKVASDNGGGDKLLKSGVVEQGEGDSYALHAAPSRRDNHAGQQSGPVIRRCPRRILNLTSFCCPSRRNHAGYGAAHALADRGLPLADADTQGASSTKKYFSSLGRRRRVYRTLEGAETAVDIFHRRWVPRWTTLYRYASSRLQSISAPRRSHCAISSVGTPPGPRAKNPLSDPRGSCWISGRR